MTDDLGERWRIFVIAYLHIYKTAMTKNWDLVSKIGM